MVVYGEVLPRRISNEQTRMQGLFRGVYKPVYPNKPGVYEVAKQLSKASSGYLCY